MPTKSKTYEVDRHFELLENSTQSKENFIEFITSLEVDDPSDPWVVDWVRECWTIEMIKEFMEDYWKGEIDHRIIWDINNYYDYKEKTFLDLAHQEKSQK